MSALDFPVIGIGASAGGIDAFHSFFDHMPADCGMAFVMILHLPPDHKSMLAEILTRWTSMSVVEVTDRVEIRARVTSMCLPPHALVTLVDGHLHVDTPANTSDRLFRPIDDFFDSLGSALRERCCRHCALGHRQRWGPGSQGDQGMRRPYDRAGRQRRRTLIRRDARRGDRDGGGRHRRARRGDARTPVALEKRSHRAFQRERASRQLGCAAPRDLRSVALATWVTTSAAIEAKPFCGESSGACTS